VADCTIHNRPGRNVFGTLVVCDWCDAGYPAEGPARDYHLSAQQAVAQGRCILPDYETTKQWADSLADFSDDEITEEYGDAGALRNWYRNGDTADLANMVHIHATMVHIHCSDGEVWHFRAPVDGVRVPGQRDMTVDLASGFSVRHNLDENCRVSVGASGLVALTWERL